MTMEERGKNSRQRYRCVIYDKPKKQKSCSTLAISMIISSFEPQLKLDENNFPALNDLITALALDNDQRETVLKILSEKAGDAEKFIIDDHTTPIAFDLAQCIFFLTLSKFSDPLLQRDLILTISTYTRPEIFLGCLYARFFAASQIENGEEVFSRIIKIISFWAKLSPDHFSPEMLESLKVFVEHLKSIYTEEVIRGSQMRLLNNSIEFIEQCFNARKLEIDVRSTVTMPSMFIKKLHEIGYKKMADQITLQQSKIFRSLSQEDLIHLIFGLSRPQSIVSYAKNFDIFSTFVSFTIIFNENPSERAEVFLMWCKITLELHKLNNYYGLFAVIGGLQHRSVRRMEKTMKVAWPLTQNIRKKFEKVESICRIENNYKEYRDVIAISQSPSIPFIGCFQKDWVYFQETVLPRKDGLISTPRISKGVQLLDKVLYMRNDDYQIEEDKDIISMITGITSSLDVIGLMKLSTSWEPSK